MSKKSATSKQSNAVKPAAKATAKGNHGPTSAGRAKTTSAKTTSAKSAAAKPAASNGAPKRGVDSLAGTATATKAAAPLERMLPQPGELKALYLRYTNGAAFDPHDKAFYFVLDVGGISRARQLIQHVEEVLAELEEFSG